MIRQLEPPTFFVTFTSAQHLWSPLCIALQQVTKNNKENAPDNLQTQTIDSLIRRHPIICSRYYRHRITTLKSLFLKNSIFFGKLQDYFFTIEFQQRGNEHEHGLLWIKDAPIYGKNNDYQITSFIDCYLSTDSSFLDENLLKIQTYHHTKTCRKNQHCKCRFNFPLPRIDKTVILHPLEHSDNLLQQKLAKEISAFLENREYKKTLPLMIS